MNKDKYSSLSKIKGRNVLLWGFYDFANTPLTLSMGGLFLAQWVVLDNKFADIWYGGTFTLATILLLLTSPFIGAWSDKTGKRMVFLKWSTLVLIITGILIGLISISTIARVPRVIIVLILFFILQYSYQISLIFYNSLLDQLSTSKTRSLISGIGEAFGEMGWLVSAIILLPFANGTITLFGEPGRGQVFLPATLVLVLLGLPMFFWLKEDKQKAKTKKVNLSLVYHDTISGFKSLLKENKNVATFLVGFMFVSDALLTASLYFAIFLDKIYKINDFQKVMALVILEVVSVLSAIIIGKLGDKIGIKKLMIIGCVNLTIVYTAVALTSSLATIYVLSAFIGLGYGAFYTTSRALLLKISPTTKIGEYFGYFSTFQKFASIIGPATWGVILLIFNKYGLWSYRIGVLSLCVLMAIGTFILAKVKNQKEKT